MPQTVYLKAHHEPPPPNATALAQTVVSICSTAHTKCFPPTSRPLHTTANCTTVVSILATPLVFAGTLDISCRFPWTNKQVITYPCSQAINYYHTIAQLWSQHWMFPALSSNKQVITYMYPAVKLSIIHTNLGHSFLAFCMHSPAGCFLPFLCC